MQQSSTNHCQFSKLDLGKLLSSQWVIATAIPQHWRILKLFPQASSIIHWKVNPNFQNILRTRRAAYMICLACLIHMGLGGTLKRQSRIILRSFRTLNSLNSLRMKRKSWGSWSQTRQAHYWWTKDSALTELKISLRHHGVRQVHWMIKMPWPGLLAVLSLTMMKKCPLIPCKAS